MRTQFVFVLEVSLHHKIRLRISEEITCCACELSMSGFGKQQLNDWYAKKAWNGIVGTFLKSKSTSHHIFRRIITAVCSEPLADSSAGHF